MLTVHSGPSGDVSSRLVFLAADEATALAYRSWIGRIGVPVRATVLRVGADVAAALRASPLAVPTVVICADDAAGAAVESARGPIAPDLLVVVGGLAAVTGPPIAVPLLVVAAHHDDSACVARTASWSDLTIRGVGYRVVTPADGGLLTADSPVADTLAALMYVVQRPVVVP